MEQDSSFNKQLRKEIRARGLMNKNNENPFDFTEFVEKQKEDNEIDLGFF